MIAKIREQAQGERPQIGLRWYANENLDRVTEDWVAVQGADWEELLLAGRKLAELEAEFGDLSRFLADRHVILKVDEAWTDAQVDEFAQGLQDSIDQGLPAVFQATEEQGDRPDLITELREEVTRWRSAAEEANRQLQAFRQAPEYVPRRPWTVVHQSHFEGRTEASGMHYMASGPIVPVIVREVRIERHLGNRPRLIVNDVMVTQGDLYVDGKLAFRVCRDDASIEVG